MNKPIGRQRRSFRSLDIVAADDARAQRWLLQTYLLSVGHRIRAATNGEAAFRLAASSPPDLVITDLEMPGGNGFDLIQAIRHADNLRLRQIPIIVCSSCGENYSLNQALDCGATSFVTKPLNCIELQIALNNLHVS